MIKLFKRSPLSARIGMLVIAVNLFVCIAAPLIAPYGETEVIGEVWESVSAPNSILGTDHLGRDLFTRMVYGARNTVLLAIGITALAFFLGIFFAFLAAVLGGWVNQLLSRSVDILMAFPTLIFALVVLSVLGTSVPSLVFVLMIPAATRVYRLARALAMNINVLDYVEVARIRGEGIFWVISREILPNTLSPLAAEFGLRFCFVFLFISSLSFLGLGLQPPTADWGGMVRENAGAITYGIMIPLIPAAAIAQLTVGINLVVDWFLHESAGRVPEEI
ncbi:MAG: ABC transporter permease [Desulfobacterales bacterium]|nr:ABC transporter permease [Desulfobacterales bacterium]